jgi:hypothetical protein
MHCEKGQESVGSWQWAVGSWQLAVGSWQLAVTLQGFETLGGFSGQ